MTPYPDVLYWLYVLRGVEPFLLEKFMIGRYRVKKDVRDNIWYLELRTMWRVGKLDWVIESKHNSHKEALEALKVKEKQNGNV